ncbi:MAG: retroviral-like aspartic protease family protein [Chthoniobacteraceae bacterium]|nr:retroviral-like aspartic protease family protein [Chthoniobacteraceae bacterium]
MCSFTVKADSKKNELSFHCRISPPFDPRTSPDGHHKYRPFIAIFDTGATHTVITQDIVEIFKLKATGVTNVYTANGKNTGASYYVNIALPNDKYGFVGHRVTRQQLPPGTDVLIGMDIIGLGDLAVTHQNGKTVFSFCYPSRELIDFAGALPVRLGTQKRRM